MQGLASAISGPDDNQSEAVSEDTSSAESESDDSSKSDMQIDFGNLFLSPELEFYLFYASYFILGSYGFGEDNFREGEGIKWNILNDKEDDEVIMTRALLKKVSGGKEWWLFKVNVDGEEYKYEMLMDDDYVFDRVRYIDRTTGKIGEFIPEKDEESESEEDIETIFADEYGQYSVGQESVRTKAGSFKAEHLVFEDIESQYKFEYWVADRAPGHIVKYIWENMEENQTISGELIDIRGGYKTELESY